MPKQYYEQVAIGDDTDGEEISLVGMVCTQQSTSYDTILNDDDDTYIWGTLRKEPARWRYLL